MFSYHRTMLRVRLRRVATASGVKLLQVSRQLMGWGGGRCLRCGEPGREITNSGTRCEECAK